MSRMNPVIDVILHPRLDRRLEVRPWMGNRYAILSTGTQRLEPWVLSFLPPNNKDGGC